MRWSRAFLCYVVEVHLIRGGVPQLPGTEPCSPKLGEARPEGPNVRFATEREPSTPATGLLPWQLDPGEPEITDEEAALVVAREGAVRQSELL